MKRVLLTVHKFFPEHRAGTEVLTLKVAQELKRRGYQVSVLTANPPDLDARRKTDDIGQQELTTYEYEGISIYCLSEEARLKNNRFSNEHYNPYLKNQFRAILDKVAPEIVHCFHLQNLSTSLIEEANLRNISVVYSATDFWLICPIVQLRRPDGSNCLGPAPLAANCLSCYTPKLFPVKKEFDEAVANKYPEFTKGIEKMPKVITDIFSESLYWSYLAKKMPEAFKATIERPALLRECANSLAAITVPTRLMRDLFVRNGLDKNLIHHVPYGIDSGPLEIGKTKSFSAEIRFAFIGALAEHKGPDLLIEAFSLLPDASRASLTLYGDLDQFPEYGKSLQKLVQSKVALSKRVKFAGVFPNEAIGEIFKNIDVLVVPSRWYENTPLVIQSALASKTPVIATNLGGMSEIIKHKQNGLLFEVNNAESLQRQIEDLIADNSLLDKLRENIKPERTIAEMVDALLAIYIEINCASSKLSSNAKASV